MTRTTVLAAILVAAAFAGASARAEPDFSADRIKAHVTFLADDLLEGREAGTRGHEIAARYVASQFALLGLKPGGRDGTLFRTGGTARIEPDRRTMPTVTLTRPGGTPVILKHGTRGRDPRARSPAAAVRLRAPLVFAGYGMEDATLGYDDYRGLDVKGKVAVVLLGSPKGMDSEIGAHLMHEQARVAAEHGAAGMILRQHPSHRRQCFRGSKGSHLRRSAADHLGAVRTASRSTRSYGLQASGLIDPNAAASLFDGAPSIARAGPRRGGQARRPANRIRAQIGGQIAVATKVRRFSSPEVIGIIEGADARLKNEYVALMAHADHIGIKRTGNGRPDQQRRARQRRRRRDADRSRARVHDGARTPAPVDPGRRNTAEEKGLLGAEYFAHYPTVPIERITAAIDLDMPMLLYDFTDVVAYGAGHSTLEGVFARAGAAMGVKLSPDPMPEQAIFVRSDHYPMVEMGVPAVMLATGMANGGEAAWGKFLSTNYHQPSDDLTQPIIWQAGAKFAEFNYRVVRDLADATTRRAVVREGLLRRSVRADSVEGHQAGAVAAVTRSVSDAGGPARRDSPPMQIVRVYDAERRPPNWTEIIRPGQFVAFAKHLDTDTPCDPSGMPFASADAVTCFIFDSLADARRFGQESVDRVPSMRVDVFESTGRSSPPLLTIVHPARVATLDGNARTARRNAIGALVLVLAAPILFWIDWAKYDGLLILPTILGINMIIIAARLIQLNGAHATAARERRARLAALGDDASR